MSNPFNATFESDCDGCATPMYDGDEVYAHEGSYFCCTCAGEMKIICPECDSHKNPDDKRCYHCEKEDNETETW